MRFRFLKPIREDERFAWLPRRLDNGTIVWLEPYRRYRILPPLNDGATHV